MTDGQLNVTLLTSDMLPNAQSFHSGNEYLDRFLRDRDALDDNFGKTYVFLSEDNHTILGYYNIGTGYIELVDDQVRRKIGGSIHINCFALDERFHGLVQEETPDGEKINLSDFLLYDCLRRIEDIRNQYIGFTFITLSSTKEGQGLYIRNGFEYLEEDMSFSVEESDKACTPMYMALDLV